MRLTGLALFQLLILGTILRIYHIDNLGIQLIVACLPGFMVQRALFRRDLASKFYSSLPFAVGMIIVDLPYMVLCATVCLLCSYWSIGFDNYTNAEQGFYFWIIFVLFIFFCVSFGQMIG